MDDFVWLVHPDTGGHFRCPTAAVKDWIDMGWESTEPPAEPDPATAEQPAQQPPAAIETPPETPKKADQEMSNG